MGAGPQVEGSGEFRRAEPDGLCRKGMARNTVRDHSRKEVEREGGG